MSELEEAFRALKRLTPSRLRLEPGAGAAPLSAVLDFQASHASARDAITMPVDWAGVTRAIAPAEAIAVHSRADSREVYIRRPDLGRRLREADLARLPKGPFDLAIVVADGLSAHAVNDNGGALVAALLAAFADLNVAPVVLVEQGRVGIGDEVGAALGADLVLVLVGERPGLSVTNSLGAYLTRSPKVGTPDSARNCVSNIHGKGGLSLADATHKINWLVRYARKLGVTGVGLKDLSDTVPLLD
ncbi:ethanolamine ammonia-lyase subunit EutC [Pseudooceanicola sp. CBS1P-1]|uniref:Ethanolamine ammonia-lyase small subunit n=1 Tax=Pseudooceanicola albus TaxID=2692189 RepID=A0A6L7G3A8_9RHOB|nr:MULTISPECIES: ethanolamine ammonia-lyase subunit EutC [Pseudooceanicola]MBT9385297.1 ethanolamine ammonia-lyase subunit EutC [Pseudooceanicola endophyticus]MXN18844.1 ethanolamine ammonia-lyase subunit EutC [Pseudooceanicola albus]